MSALCQKRTYAVAAKRPLIRSSHQQWEQRRGYVEAAIVRDVDRGFESLTHRQTPLALIVRVFTDNALGGPVSFGIGFSTPQRYRLRIVVS
jgi:hypothetical protein